MTEARLLELGFKFIGKSKDLHKDGCFLHKRKRGYVINKRVPIIETEEQLEGYMKFALGKKLING